MQKDGLEGIFPVLVVPFKENREIDYDSFRNLINFVYDKKVDGIMLFGLGSEFYKISDEESFKLMEILIEVNKGRGKIIIGVGRPGTENTIKQAKFCQMLKVDALIIFPPYCVPINAKQLFDHYVEVSNSVDLPIIIQDSPIYSGVNMDINFFIELNKKCSNIKYAKIENNLSGPKISQIIEKTEGKLKIFAGKGGTHFYEHLLRGVCGLMPGCAIIELFVDIYKKYNENKYKESEDIFEDIATFLYLEDQDIEYFIASEKTILNYRKVIKSFVSRKPETVLDKLSKDTLLSKLNSLMIKYEMNNNKVF